MMVNTRKTGAVGAAMLAMLFVAGLFPSAAGAQMVNDQVFSGYVLIYSSATATVAATPLHSAPQYVGDAQHVFVAYTTSNCGATSEIAVAIQWLEENHTRTPTWAGATNGNAYTLTSGWYETDTNTSDTRVSSGDFVTSSPVRSPWMRLLVVSDEATDGDKTADPRVVAYMYKRYVPLATVTVGSRNISGVDEFRAEDGYFTDDVRVGDDLIVGDDAAVGGDLAVTGSTGLAAVTATGVTVTGDVTFEGSNSDVLQVDTARSTATVTGDFSVITSTTVVYALGSNLFRNVYTTGTAGCHGQGGISSWTLTTDGGYIQPADNTSNTIWATIPVSVGSVLDSAEVRYTDNNLGDAVDLVIALITMDGDGTMTTQDTVTGTTASGSWKTLSTSAGGTINYTVIATGSVQVALTGDNIALHAQTLSVHFDTYSLGNP